MRRATTGFANRYGRELMRLPLRIPNAVELSDFLFIAKVSPYYPKLFFLQKLHFWDSLCFLFPEEDYFHLPLSQRGGIFLLFFLFYVKKKKVSKKEKKARSSDFIALTRCKCSIKTFLHLEK